MYIPNVPDEFLKLIIQTGKQILEKLNLVVSNIEKDMSKAYEFPVVRFKITKNQNEKPLDPHLVNLSNVNAYHIFRDILNYEKDLWEDGSFDIEELKKRIIYFLGETKYPERNKEEEIEEHDRSIQNWLLGKEPLKGYEWKQPNMDELANMLSGRSGVSSYTSEDVTRILNQILDFCNLALSRGYKKAYLA